MRKNILFTLLILMFCFNCLGQVQNTITEISNRGGIHQEIFFDCNLEYPQNINRIDTVLFEFQNKGNIIAYVEYQNGLKVKAVGYYDNRQKFEETNFNGHKMHGIHICWYKNGQIRSIVHYKNGVQISPDISWYETGELEGYSSKEFGKNIGYDKMYYKNGKIRVDCIYVDSTETGYIETEYYENGNKKYFQICNAGTQPCKRYYENGQISVDGLMYRTPFFPTGHWQEWFENGVMSREYFFHNTIPNQREGTWKWWDEKGNLINEEYYKNGEKTGEKEYVPIKKQNEK